MRRRCTLPGGQAKRRRWVAAAGWVGGWAWALLAGCHAPAPSEPPPLVARFFLEAKANETGLPVALPVSGVGVTVAAKPVFSEYDVLKAEVAEVELGRCLWVQLKPAAARDLYRMSVGARDRRLVLALNEEFVGARRIEGAMGEGVILIFLEKPDEELPGLVNRMNHTSAEIARAARKVGAR